MMTSKVFQLYQKFHGRCTISFFFFSLKVFLLFAHKAQKQESAIKLLWVNITLSFYYSIILPLYVLLCLSVHVCLSLTVCLCLSLCACVSLSHSLSLSLSILSLSLSFFFSICLLSSYFPTFFVCSQFCFCSLLSMLLSLFL